MDNKELLAQLAKPNLGFVERLRLAVRANLEFWDNRKTIPNLTEYEFRNVLLQIPLSTVPNWKERDSQSGEHGKTGENIVFDFEFDVVLFGRRTRYYVKGYFFDLDVCRGVTIQSFRRVNAPPKLRVIQY